MIFLAIEIVLNFLKKKQHISHIQDRIDWLKSWNLKMAALKWMLHVAVNVLAIIVQSIICTLDNWAIKGQGLKGNSAMVTQD